MDVISAWNAVLRPDVELSRRYCEEFAAAMRARKLTFGDRVHCPFLRPFFLAEADESRMRRIIGLYRLEFGNAAAVVVIHMLEKEIKKIMPPEESNTSKEDVQKRLRGLGYIE